jgi:hypothetical protein
MEVSGQLQASAALRPEKEPFDRRLGGSQSRSGRGDEKKKFSTLPGIEPRSSSPQPDRYTD